MPLSCIRKLKDPFRWGWGYVPNLLLLLLCFLGAGCAHVRPWERDALAMDSMKSDRDPAASAIREHRWFSREAANGGRAVGGGGCGCN